MPSKRKTEKRHFVVSEPKGAKAPFDSEIRKVLERVSQVTGESPIKVQSRPNLSTLSVEASHSFLLKLAEQPEILKSIEPAVGHDVLIRPTKVKQATLKSPVGFSKKPC